MENQYTKNQIGSTRYPIIRAFMEPNGKTAIQIRSKITRVDTSPEAVRPEEKSMLRKPEKKEAKQCQF